jgi:hypothetical protein
MRPSISADRFETNARCSLIRKGVHPHHHQCPGIVRYAVALQPPQHGEQTSIDARVVFVVIVNIASKDLSVIATLHTQR